MKLIVGLGNPGPEYELTPHNMGFLVVDHIAETLKVQVANRHCRAVTARGRMGNAEVLLAKPETFMNLSGDAVRQLVAKYDADPAQDLIVLYDDLDFPLGTLKIRERGGPGTHNGMKSIIAALGSEHFTRLRLGIGRDEQGRHKKGYVLDAFRKKDMKAVGAMIENAASAVEAVVKDGVKAAMNGFNRTDEAKAKYAEKTGKQ